MSGVATQVDEKKIRAQLKKWQERLLDLTKGNPLLGLNRSRVSKLRVTRTARLFGIERATTESCDHIVEVADELVERGLLREDAGRLLIPE